VPVNGFTLDVKQRDPGLEQSAIGAYSWLSAQFSVFMPEA
jgi:hypothetical protein